MPRFFIATLTLLFAVSIPACGGGVRYRYEGVRGVVTLTNSHPDRSISRAFARGRFSQA